MPQNQHKTTIGGQALIEGIIMRGPERSCTVVRKSDGTLVTKEKELSSAARSRFFRLPFIRGTFSLVDSMREGIDAINYSASFFEEAEEEPGRFEKWLIEKFGKEKMEQLLMSLAVLLGCLLPVGLFILLPTVVAGFFSGFIGSGLGRSLLEGLFRIVIFLAFIFCVSKQSDIHRTFMYHGAEHKSIFCYEAGLPLTVENARLQSRLHPRCGTSFLFTVVIVSTLITSLFSWDHVLIRLLVRLLLIPVIVGISYEINRFAGRHDNAFTAALRAPGLALQRITTAEPTDDMLEVALAALTPVIPEDKNADAW